LQAINRKIKEPQLFQSARLTFLGDVIILTLGALLAFPFVGLENGFGRVYFRSNRNGYKLVSAALITYR